MAVTYLLDVNVLLALWWEPHVDHERVASWFARSVKSWATAPITQLGFVRLASLNDITGGKVTPTRAMDALQQNVDVPEHTFWPADIEFASSVRASCHKLLGSKQVTDAYLVALADRHGGKLATLDRGIAELVKRERAADLVELITSPPTPGGVQ